MRSSLFSFSLLAVSLVLPGTLHAASEQWVIDPERSFVRAYVPEWTSFDDGSSLGVLWTETYRQDAFSLSGSFEFEREDSLWDSSRARLTLVTSSVESDAPDHAAFDLPRFFAVQGEALAYDSHPCFDFDFYFEPSSSSSCSGGSIGLHRSDAGSVDGDTVSLSGVQSGLFPLGFSFYLPRGTSPEAPPDVNRVEGLFEYQLVAVSAVPEPATALLFLAGGAVLALRRGREKR